MEQKKIFKIKIHTLLKKNVLFFGIRYYKDARKRSKPKNHMIGIQSFLSPYGQISQLQARKSRKRKNQHQRVKENLVQTNF
jgi:hypothetical protein